MSETDEQEQPRRCLVCGRNELADHELQTCIGCIDRTRRALIAVEQMYALLPDEIASRAGAASPIDQTGTRSDEDPIPGGDALILLAGGSGRWHSEHVDVDSVLGVLTRWEDDWRITLGLAPAGWTKDSKGAATDHRYAPQPTVSGCAVFLHRGLAHMAQHHPTFNEFAYDIRQLRGQLEQALREGDPTDKAAIRCDECDSQLRKRYTKPDPDDVPFPKRMRVLVREPSKNGQPGKERWIWKPDWNTQRRRIMAWNRRRLRLDQGGRRDDWECSNPHCERVMTGEEYNLLVHEKMRQEALPARDLALLLGVTASRVRQIVSKHGIQPVAKDGKAPLYPVADVMQHARPDREVAS